MSLRIYGNRQLKTLAGQATRPTPARVRQALFNIWQGTITDCRWLDLCSGSGAMGAEALCRGAAQVVGIELSGSACRVIQANWQQVAQPSQSVTLLRGDVRSQLKRLQGQQFDHIYFDPPYDQQELYAVAIAAISQYALLSPTGELAVEFTPLHWQPIHPPGLRLIQQKQYGKTALAFYRRDSSPGGRVADEATPQVP